MTVSSGLTLDHRQRREAERQQCMWGTTKQRCAPRCLTAERPESSDQKLVRQSTPPSQVEGGDAMHQKIMSDYSGNELDLTQRQVEE